MVFPFRQKDRRSSFGKRLSDVREDELIALPVRC